MSKKFRRSIMALLILMSASISGLVATGAIEGGGAGPPNCDPGDSRAFCVDGNFDELSIDVCNRWFQIPAGKTMRFLGASDSSGPDDLPYLETSSTGTLLDLDKGGTTVLLGVALQGDKAYNVYGGDTAGLHAPINEDGSNPTISHWTACYYIPEVVTTTTTTQATTTTVPEVTTTTQGQTTTTCDPYVCVKVITTVLN